MIAAPDILPTLAALSPADAYDDYQDRLARARSTRLYHRLGLKLGYLAAEARLTGVSTEEGERIEAVYAAWERAQPGPAAPSARREFVGPQRCGSCGGEFAEIDELIGHESFCNFRPGAHAKPPMIRE